MTDEHASVDSAGEDTANEELAGEDLVLAGSPAGEPAGDPAEGLEESTLVGRALDPEFRAGFVAVVGRPNVGKSTLTNAMVGQKIAITSMRPETTRRNIRGIVTRPDGQLVLVDTPGLHRPRTLLGKRLNEMVQEALVDVDAIAVCFPADQKVGPGDRYITREAGYSRAPKVAVVTKMDKVSQGRLAEHLLAVDRLDNWAAIVPVSAKTGENMDTLLQVLIGEMPPSPMLYPEDEVTEETEEVLIAEFVREAALEGVEEELPHSIVVEVTEMVQREPEPDGKPGLLDVYVTIYVERDSQKGIIIGKGGKRLRQVGTQSRRQIEKLLGRRIYLHLHVTVAKNWQTDPKMLQKFGF